jgi:hypothetical protein
MKAEHIESYTYIGKDGGVLVITTGQLSEQDENKNYYDEEAEKIYRFLLSIFCNKTIRKLKEKIAV